MKVSRAVGGSWCVDEALRKHVPTLVIFSTDIYADEANKVPLGQISRRERIYGFLLSSTQTCKECRLLREPRRDIPRPPFIDMQMIHSPQNATQDGKSRWV